MAKQKCAKCTINDNLTYQIDKLTEENAELKAKLEKSVELPCKVGDRIYEVLFGKVLPGTVIGFRKGKIAGDIEEACESKEWMIEFSNMGGSESSYPISCIGEDLFFTKEEAEQALKGAQKQNAER